MDITYLLWLQNIREQAGILWEYVFYGITMLGAAGIGLALVIYLCKDKKKGFFITACFCLGTVMNGTLKNICCVYRPWIRDRRIIPSALAKPGATGYSFPSGHSQTAATTYGSAAWVYRKHRKTAVILILLVLLTGFSRNYLGVHTPQDVIVGLLEGCICIFLVQKFFEWYRRKKRSDLKIVITGLVVTGVLILFTLLKPYPMTYENGKLLVDPISMQADSMKSYGFFTGLLCAWALERKYIGFTTDHMTMKKALLRLVICGILGMFGYMVFGHFAEVLFDERLTSFVGAFMALFLSLFIGPIIFTKIEKRMNSEF